VINVRMGQQYGVDVCGIEREVEAVAAGRVMATLDQPAIDEQSPSSYPKDVAGSRHFTGGAEEFDFQV